MANVSSEREIMLRLNKAFGHVTVAEDAVMSHAERGDISETTGSFRESEASLGYDKEDDGTVVDKCNESGGEKREPIMGGAGTPGDGTVAADNDDEKGDDKTRPKYKCEKCHQWIPLGRELFLHDQMHHGGQFSCSECDLVLADMASLNEHRLLHHSQQRQRRKKKIRQCQFCPRIFNFQHMVDRHVLSEHPEHAESLTVADGNGDVMRCCDECGQTFATSALLTYHIKRQHRIYSKFSNHDPRPCPLCQTYSRSLLTHMKARHPTAPRYQCRYCPEMFAKLRTRKTHAEKMHRCHRCKYCGQEVPSHAHLLRHLPLCTAAPDSHRQAWSRKIKDAHSRIYNCSHCERKFAAMNRLRRHEKEEHGVYQELQCHICHKTFATNCSFK